MADDLDPDDIGHSCLDNIEETVVEDGVQLGICGICGSEVFL